MDRLRRDEWRDVKGRAERMSFECDLLGQLPLEIVALIAEHMELADLILLRRVSQRWRQVLSSPSVCLAAIRATLGAMPNVDPTMWIKRRLRMERGRPSHKIQFPSPLSPVHDTLMNLRGVGYLNGIYAWLEGSDGRTSVALLNLWTGRLTRLTTDNREQLVELRMSETLVAVISTRGFCHIWNINTEEYKNFRLSSLQFKHFLVNETKVALGYRDHLVHWGFNTELAHTIPIGLYTVSMALHPTIDQFAVITLCQKYRGENQENGAGTTDPAAPPEFPNLCRMRTETFALNGSNEFHLTSSHVQNLPFGYEWVCMVSHPEEIYHGQSTVLLQSTTPNPEGEASSGFYLTIDSDQNIMAHSVPTDLFKVTNLVCLEKGVIYAPTTSKDALMIVDSSETNISWSEQPTMSWLRNSVKRNAPCMNCHWMFGDSDFIILVNLRHVEIWSFSDTWDFSRLASRSPQPNWPPVF